ncbi:uncharacterized protein [Apostichopus japonicus]|uniref:uncharacterized protein isoform X2 n=1 Tax=Stichopus japonicus TaxID=307972 RepID=UPI003AB4EC2A
MCTDSATLDKSSVSFSTKMDSSSSSNELDVDAESSDDGTNIDDPGEKYTGTPVKVPKAEEKPEKGVETGELSSSESEDTLVCSSSESEVYLDASGSDVTESKSETIVEAAHDIKTESQIESPEKNPEKDTNLSFYDRQAYEQEEGNQEERTQEEQYEEARPIDEPTVETEEYSSEQAGTHFLDDLPKGSNNDDDNKEVDKISIPRKEVKEYVDGVIQDACNKLDKSLAAGNNNDIESDQHVNLRDYDIVSTDDPTTMGEGASKLQTDLSKHPSIPADVSNLTEDESVGPTGDAVIIIDYKKRKFSNEDEDLVSNEQLTVVESFVKKLKRDDHLQDEQASDYQSVPSDSLASSPLLEPADSIEKDDKDDHVTEDNSQTVDGSEAAFIGDIPVFNEDSNLPPLKGPDSYENGENLERYVEPAQEEHMEESESAPESEVLVGSEILASENSSDEGEPPVSNHGVEIAVSQNYSKQDETLKEQDEREQSNISINIDVMNEDSNTNNTTMGYGSIDDRAAQSQTEDAKEENIEPVIIIDYENREMDFTEPNIEKNEQERLINKFAEDLERNYPLEEKSSSESSTNDGEIEEVVSIKSEQEQVCLDNNGDNADSDILSEALDETPQRINHETLADDVIYLTSSVEDIESEKLAVELEEKVLLESCPIDSRTERDKESPSDSQLVYFLAEDLERQDANKNDSSAGDNDDQSITLPVEEQFGVDQISRPEISKIENFLNEMDQGKTNSVDLLPNKPSKRTYTPEEVRRAIQILTSKPPYDDIDPESFYSKMSGPGLDGDLELNDRVFALVMTPKQEERKARMFGIFSVPKVPLSDNRYHNDLNKESNQIPVFNDKNAEIDLYEVLQNLDQPIIADIEKEMHTIPDHALQNFPNRHEREGDGTEGDEDNDGSLSTSSASSGMYILEDYSAIQEELNEDERVLLNGISSDNEDGDSLQSAGGGQVFCVTSKQDYLNRIAQSQSVPANFSSSITGLVEKPKATSSVPSQLSHDDNVGEVPTLHDENAPFQAEVFVETETRILHLSDDRVEFDMYLVHQTPNVDISEQEDATSHEKGQGEYSNSEGKEEKSDSLSFLPEKLPSEDSAVVNANPPDQDVGVDFNVYIEHSLRDDNALINEYQDGTEERVVPTSVQSPIFYPQTLDGKEWASPLAGENNEKNVDLTFQVTTPTYITFEENVLPANYGDNFVAETEVVPHFLDPDESCPFTFEFQNENEPEVPREPHFEVLRLGNGETTPNNKEYKQQLLDSIADILDDSVCNGQSDAESIVSNPPHFYDKNELPVEDTHSIQEFKVSQPLDLSACLPEMEDVDVCPGGSSFAIVGTPCKNNEIVELPTLAGFTESAPFHDNDAIDAALTDDFEDQQSTSSESSSTDSNDDNEDEGVPYEQFQNEAHVGNETQAIDDSDFPSSFSLALDQLSDSSSSTDDESANSLPVELADDAQGNSSGRKSSTSSSSCSSNDTAQEPGVPYAYLEDDGDDFGPRNSFHEDEEYVIIHSQDVTELSHNSDEDTIHVDFSSTSKRLLENEMPQPDQETGSGEDMIGNKESIALTVYLEKEPLDDIDEVEETNRRYENVEPSSESDDCKAEQPVERTTESEVEAVQSSKDEQVVFNMYLDKPPLKEVPVEYDEYLEQDPRENSDEVSEPGIVEEDVFPHERDEVHCMVPNDTPGLVPLHVGGHERDMADPDQCVVLSSDSDDVTPPRYRFESSSPASAFSDSDDQEQPEISGPPLVFALIGRPLDIGNKEERVDGYAEPSEENVSSDLPIVFQGSVEVYREEVTEGAQKTSVTSFQEVFDNSKDDMYQLSIDETAQQNTQVYIERESHIVHQSVTTIEVARSMFPS